MSAFDTFALAVMALSLLVGVLRGVVSELLSLAAWVVAFLVARQFAPWAGDLLLAEVTEPMWRQIAGFIALFVAVLILFALGRALATLLIKAVGLRPLDRALGALFGVLRGLLILLVLVLLGGLTPLPQERWWRESISAAPLETAVLAIRPWLPPELARRLRFR